MRLGGTPESVPCKGWATIEYVSVWPSAGKSVAPRRTEVAVLWSAARLWPWATGASLTEFTVIVTVAGLDDRLPSVAVYVSVAVPKKFAGGAYVSDPSEANVSEPATGSVALFAVNVVPSGSESFASTPVASGTTSVVSSSTE